MKSLRQVLELTAQHQIPAPKLLYFSEALISVSTVGRPPAGRAESLVQYARKRRRCRRNAVSGDTVVSGCLQPAQTQASPTHNRRSVVHSFGRGTVRLYTASCRRGARVSR